MLFINNQWHSTRWIIQLIKKSLNFTAKFSRENQTSSNVASKFLRVSKERLHEQRRQVKFQQKLIRFSTSPCRGVTATLILKSLNSKAIDNPSPEIEFFKLRRLQNCLSNSKMRNWHMARFYHFNDIFFFVVFVEFQARGNRTKVLRSGWNLPSGYRFHSIPKRKPLEFLTNCLFRSPASHLWILLHNWHQVSFWLRGHLWTLKGFDGREIAERHLNGES